MDEVRPANVARRRFPPLRPLVHREKRVLLRISAVRRCRDLEDESIEIDRQEYRRF